MLDRLQKYVRHDTDSHDDRQSNKTMLLHAAREMMAADLRINGNYINAPYKVQQLGRCYSVQINDTMIVIWDEANNVVAHEDTNPKLTSTDQAYIDYVRQETGNLD